jgi:3-mercaptopyruvate sulfurtransferase SseA
VRSKDEYFEKRGEMYKEPDIQALHMEWKEFYLGDGRPDLKVKRRLKALGYSESDEIIVFSNRGVRSSAAAYSLIANGFTKVRNFIP